jgi:hypothetical protein
MINFTETIDRDTWKIVHFKCPQGYIKIANIAEDSAFMTDVTSFVNMVRNAALKPINQFSYEKGILPSSSDFWIYLRFNVGIDWHEMNRMNESYTPRERLEYMENVIIPQMEKHYATQMEYYRKLFSEYTYVDFSRVYDEYKRQGYGTKLYLTAAKFSLTEMGIPLRQSTCSSDSAKGLWKSLADKGIAKHGNIITPNKKTIAFNYIPQA